jgi:hypothetical protein
MDAASARAASELSAPAGGAGWSTVARVIAREVVLPYVVYLALHSAGVSNLLALAAGAAAAVLIMAASAVRHERPTALTGIVLLSLILSIVVSLISGNARVTLARDCLITGGFGVVLLASLTRRRPLLFYVLAPLAAPRLPGGESEFQRRFDESATLRSTLTLSTLVWGLVLLADAALRLTAVLVLPVTAAATAATVLTIITVIVLVSWLRFYLPRRLRINA